MLLHEVGHGEVSVCGVPLREEDCVVEPDVLVSGDSLHVIHHVIELLC